MDASSSCDRSAITTLVVEDSPNQAAQLRMVLEVEVEQFTVLMAKNGCAALAVLRETLPTMVITDVVMPEMDGYQLCDTIKKGRALHDIPVIMMTSLVSWDDITRNLECGATHFLCKPYGSVALISRINYIYAIWVAAWMRRLCGCCR
ncbi:response regulator [Chitinimonas prasina]|nr:response regulator [Chitinimonas prasina]